MTKEISQLTPKGAALATTDLLEVSVSDGMGGYVTKSETGANVLAAIPNVTFQNDYYIADNGNDSTGNGSQSKPFLTSAHTNAVILSLSPSSSNKFFVHDERNFDITENIQFLPFVSQMGNGNAKWTGNISLHSSFGSIASDCFSTFGGYKEWTSGSTLTLDFSGFPLTHQILINLVNIPKAPITYSIIGNDAANFNADTFRVNEYDSFNTGGRNFDGSYWKANVTLSSGVTRRIRYADGWQLTSIVKSLGSVPAITFLDVAFCGTAFYNISTNTLALINSGGASNQPFTLIQVLNCVSGQSPLNLDITNDQISSVTITTDITTGYFINSSDNLGNITFINYNNADYQSSIYIPTNYTKTSYDDGGFAVTTDMLGSQLKGIDIELGSVAGDTYNPGYIHGFSLKWNSVGPPATITIGSGNCRDKDNSFNMTLASPVTLDTTSASIDNGASWSSGSWYGIWLYEKSSDLTTTMKFSLSFSSPAAISGYDKVRLVGSVKAQTAGTNIMAFVQRGISNDRTYYWNDADTSLILLTSGSAVVGAPGTFSCALGQSPISNEIDMQYGFTPGIARAGDDFSISNADFNGLALVYFSGAVALLNSTGRVGFLPTNSSQNLSYFVDNAADDLNLKAIAYKESL